MALLKLLDEGVVKYEQGLKGLTTVLPELAGNQQALNQVGQSLIQTTEKYGTSMDDSLTIAKNFGRAYKDQATVLGLVDEVTKLNVVDNVELAQAQAGVQAGLSTYGKAFQDTNDVLSFSGDLIDKITNLAHNALVNATDLTVGLQKSSAAAMNAGVSLDQFLGLMAAGTKTTGLPGSQIAQALKTIFAQLAAPSKQVEDDLDKIGIKVRDANGNLRDAYDIILDLSKATKDSTYSQEDLNTAIEKVARGSVNYSKLAAIVGNYGEIVKDTNLSQQAAGKTNEVAAQQLDTLARKLQTTKNILIGMFADAGTSGLSGELKGLVDGINQFLLGLSKVSPLVIDGGIALAGLGIAVKVATGMYDAISGAVARFIPLKAAATASTVAKTVALEADTVATEEAATATTALDVAMDANPVALVTLAIMGLGGALVAYIYHAGAAAKQQLELNSSVDDAAQKYEDLNDKLSKAAQGTQEHRDLQNQSNTAMQELAQLMPDVVSKWDAEGNAVAIDNDKLRENIELHKEDAIAAANANTVKAEIAAQQAQGILSARVGAMESWQQTADRDSNAMPWVHNSEVNTLSAYKNQVDQAQAAAKDAKDAAAQAWKQWQDLSNGKTTIPVLGAGPGDDAGGANGSGGSSGGSAGSSTNTTANYLKSLSDAVDEYKIANDAMNQSLAGTATALNINQSMVDLLSDRIKNGTATIQDYANYQSLLADRQKDLKQEQDELIQQNTMYAGELPTLKAKLEEAEDAYSKFAAAGDQTNMQGAQTAVQKLQSDIDSMSKTLDSNVAAINKDQQAWEDLVNKGYQDAATQLETYTKDFADMGILRPEQELKLLESIDAQNLSLDQQLSLAKDITDVRKTMLTDEENKAVAAIQAQKDAYDATANAQITSLQSELDLMKQQDSTQQEITDLADKQTAYAQAQLDLATAQANLTNAQNQKNERVYANGVWSYEADPKAVSDAQTALTSAQTAATNAYNALLQAQTTYQEDQLQSQIDAAKTAQTTQDKSHDQAITDAKAYYDKLINNVEAPAWVKTLALNKMSLGQLQTDTDTYLSSMEASWGNYLKYVQAVIKQIPSIGAGTGTTSMGASNSSSGNTNLTTIDSGVKISGLTLNLQNVTSVDQLIAQLKQIAS